MRRCRTMLAAALAATAGVVVTTQVAHAAPIACTNAALISAISSANSGGGTITLPAGCTYALTSVNNSTDGNNGLPVITGNVTIAGSGATISRSTVSGTPTFRIFNVASGGALTLNSVAINNGVADGAVYGGGGVFSRGTVTVTGSSFTNNIAIVNSGTGGGGINAHHGTLTVTNSTFTGNQGATGGGIEDESTATVTNSTFINNAATGYDGGGFDTGTATDKATIVGSTFIGNSGPAGGGIDNGGNTSVSNSTFYNNSAGSGGGGGIQNFSVLTVSQSTLSANNAASGADLHNYGSGSVTVTSSIVANGVSGTNCGGPAMTDGGYNLDSGSSCGFSATKHSLTTSNPQLGGLASNGGPTQTMAPAAGSPAIDAIPTTVSGCTGTVDQRGTARPQGPACDIGSVEVTSGGADTQAPTVPSGLQTTSVTPSSVAFHWTASTDNVGVTGYTVYRGGVSLGTTTLTSYTDSTVSPSTPYSYTVDAYDAAGNHSAQSTALPVTTPASPDTQPPSTPSGLTKGTVTANAASFSWTASTDNVGVTGYTVYRGGVSIGTTTTTSYTDSTVSPSTPYSYTVDAYDAAGNHSAQSSALPVTTPAAPPPTAKWVQGGAVATGTRVASVTIGLGSAVSAGDLLVGWFGQYDSTGQVKVSDNVNGAWTRSSTAITFSGGGGDIALYYVQNAKAATAGLVVTIAATTATYLQGSASDYSGMATTNSLDSASAALGTGTAADSGATASVPAGEVLISGFMTGTGPGTVTAGSGMTLRDHTASYSVDDADATLSAGGPQHAAWTLSTSADWYVVGAVFRTAAGTKDTQPPTVPTGLQTTSVTPSSVAFHWTPSTDNVGVTGYTVYRGGVNIGTTPTASYTDSTVSPSTPYSYTVDAYDAASNHSAQSAALAVTTPATPDTTPPSTPTGLTQGTVTATSASFSWTASTDNVAVTGYTVYRGGVSIGTTTATSYTDTTVAPSTPYSYTVDAYDAAGNHSPQSTALAITTPAPPDTQAPTVPTGLQTTSVGPSSVAFHWTASTDNVGVTGYTVYRGGVNIGTTPTASYTDNTVSPSTPYSYTVDAYDAASNHSAQSTALAVTTPATPDTTPPSTPTGLTQGTVTSTSASFSWTASTDNVAVTGYTVYRGGVSIGTTTATSYTDSTVAPSTPYSYTVDAFDAAGNHSPQSTALAITTPATPPPTATWVQGGAIATGSRVGSVTITLASPVGAGDLLVGWFGQYDSTGQVNVSDTVNGAWTRSSTAITFSGGGGDIALYYVQNAKAAAAGLVITISATTATYLQGSASDYSGMATTNSLASASAAMGKGTAADSGATGSVSAGELLISGFMTGTGPGTVTAGSGMTMHAHTGSYSVDDASAFVSTAGTQHAQWALQTSADWYVVAAVFHTAAGP